MAPLMTSKLHTEQPDVEQPVEARPAQRKARPRSLNALRDRLEQAGPAARRSWWQFAADLLRLARPRQWAKNVFVLAPLIFSRSFFSLDLVAAALGATACFCLFSSAVYLFNDVLDAEADRRHPRKCRRPIPAGRVSKPAALALAAALTAAGASWAWYALPISLLVLGGLYLLNSLLYCLLLKHHAICDVLAIAVGFVLRLLAGCAAIGVEPSSWALICGFALALTLGFGKRRAEVGSLDRPDDYRPVLRFYDVQKLDTLLAINCALCIFAYVLYTVAPDTVALHGTTRLVYTIPFVVYGLYRFLFRVQEARGDGPVEILTSDPAFAVNGLAWIGSVIAVLLFP
jgi:4-hydroxybenzoate polyprenyltransferase